MITRKTINEFPNYSNIFFNMISFLLSANFFNNMEALFGQRNIEVNIPHPVPYVFNSKNKETITAKSPNRNQVYQQPINVDIIKTDYQKFI